MDEIKPPVETDHQEPQELAKESFAAVAPIKPEKAPRMKRIGGGAGHVKTPKPVREYIHRGRRH